MDQNINKKLSVGQFLKSVFNIFIKNLGDIAIISVLFALPTIIGRGNAIFSVIGIFDLGFSSIAIIKLANNFIRGEKVSWIETIKSAFKNPLFPLGVFLIQNFVCFFRLKHICTFRNSNINLFCNSYAMFYI
ncbi:hypothetical protein R2R32_15405 [Clostridium perfringens]|nr:hypothetical protein [Clostridium perfringens]